MIDKNSKILITGGAGMTGIALAHQLKSAGYKNVLAIDRKSCDLMDWSTTKIFFQNAKPDVVFHLAAAIFGIMGNMRQKGLNFFHNTLINTHVVEASRLAGAKKIVAMGTGAAYPYPSPGLPLQEDMIWYGLPHPAHDSYSHSKRAMLAQLIAYKEDYDLDYAFVISCNLYGPQDKFDIKFGNVIPSLIRKFYEAKQSGSEVVVWGDGSARRDFLYSQDAADALINILENISGAVNIGSGSVYAIKDIVNCLSDYTGLGDKIIWDATKPNGQDYRAYDLTKLQSTGFKPKFSIEQGLKQAYDWYAAHATVARK